MVVCMDVPCCGGIEYAAKEALQSCQKVWLRFLLVEKSFFLHRKKKSLLAFENEEEFRKNCEKPSRLLSDWTCCLFDSSFVHV